DFADLQEHNRNLVENNWELLKEVEALRHEPHEPGDDQQDEQCVEENAQASKDEIKYWKKATQISGR
ncbi:hypothetical protein FRC10_004505, partial [Ceratobasidium sp. 414]